MAKVLKTSKASPAPLAFRRNNHMGPIVVLRGLNCHYNILLSELENYAKGIGFLENESCRLFWDGMPIWGKLKLMSTLFKQSNSAVVASTYCNSWIFDDFMRTTRSSHLRSHILRFSLTEVKKQKWKCLRTGSMNSG
jgi:benzoyl-CoA reductase/2-hydroxyglutaryl-CoA dehydratase subunit BcrC/BadD/HgdB